MSTDQKQPQPEAKFSQALDNKFDLIGVNPGPYNVLLKKTGKRIDVDFRTMTVEQAQMLVDNGCPNIKAKGTAAKPQA